MDEIELLVAETFRHFNENYAGIIEEAALPKEDFGHGDALTIPDGPGVIYHVQKSTSVFVIRTMVSANMREDLNLIFEQPENYPSLRLLEGGDKEISHKLKFFIVENPSQAEIIHDQLHNRRFPINEEMMCNLSDPGFSWWLTKKERGFQLAFTMSVSSHDTIKIGPLGDRELALKNFHAFEQLVLDAGLKMNIQNEMNRVQFADCEEFILEELKDIFEFGAITQTLKDIFKILSKKCSNKNALEETWFYLQELAAMRRFWIQIQYDIQA